MTTLIHDITAIVSLTCFCLAGVIELSNNAKCKPRNAIRSIEGK